MSKPQKSTREKMLDQFADFNVADQESFLDDCELIHRQAKRRAGKKSEAPPAPPNTGATQKPLELKEPVL